MVAFWARLLPALSVAVTVTFAFSFLPFLSARLTAFSLFFASLRRSFTSALAATDRRRS